MLAEQQHHNVWALARCRLLYAQPMPTTLLAPHL
jgi:hypothetical protein